MTVASVCPSSSNYPENLGWVGTICVRAIGWGPSPVPPPFRLIASTHPLIHAVPYVDVVLPTIPPVLASR